MTQVFEKHQVVMLSANEKAKIGDIVMSKFDDIHILTKNDGKEYTKTVTSQHLYILSDEEIKVGDWIYDEDNGVVKIEHKYQLSNINVFRKDCKKIVATTDKSLGLSDVGKSGYSVDEFYPVLPQPSEEFIEYFVEEYNKGNVINRQKTDTNIRHY